MLIKVVFFGPLSQKIDGGFDRMNNNIVSAFQNDPDIELIRLPTMKNRLKGKIKVVLYPGFIIISLIRELWNLIGIIIKKKPHILHATPMYGLLMIREIFILLLAKLAGMKVIFDIRAGSFMYHFNKPVFKWIYQFSLKISDQILVEGKKYMPFLNDRGFKSKYFPNYTDQNQIQNLYEYNNSNQLKFIYVGRVLTEKGIDDSIEVLKILSEKYHVNLQFSIIGGYDQKYIDQLHKRFGYFMEKVIFCGYMGKKEIDKMLSESDFFMFLTSWRGEGHSNAINEAMSAGVPVLYYDHGFTLEIIENDRFMLLKGQSIDNAKKIAELIADEKYITLERKRLQDLISQKYSLEIMKPFIKNVYLEISGGI